MTLSPMANSARMPVSACVLPRTRDAMGMFPPHSCRISIGSDWTFEACWQTDRNTEPRIARSMARRFCAAAAAAAEAPSFGTISAWSTC